MKNLSKIKKRLLYACSCAIFSIMFVLPVSANSAQYAWSGTTNVGVVSTEETCPLVVDREVLTFDLQEFPQQNYRESDDYLAYNGNVTAEYTFSNPSDYTVSAELVFPFGTIPDYGYLYDESGGRILNADTEKYGVMVDGKETEKTLRHTLLAFRSEFELDVDMALLQNGWVEDRFYSPDMTVTRYIYVPQQIDIETYDAACAAFILPAAPDRAKVLLENQSGCEVLNEGVRVSCWIEADRPVMVDVIGEPLSEMPEWTVYENGACDTEIDGTMKLTGTETMTLKEFALTAYDEKSGVLEYDWYNAVVELLRLTEWNEGMISGSEFRFDISDQLMRWYQYEITVAPGEKIINTVTAPVYPSLNMQYEPPVYSYTYLLSPAGTWKEFGTLDIEIHTPYTITEHNLEEVEQTDEGYRCSLDGLPEGELTFSLCETAEPKSPAGDGTYIPVIVVAVGVMVVALLFIFWKRKR